MSKVVDLVESLKGERGKLESGKGKGESLKVES
jgi:hypothetical protein